jgi:hypothetical protein
MHSTIFELYIVNLGDIYNLRKYYNAVDLCMSCFVLRMYIDLFCICRRLAGYGFIERINMNMNMNIVAIYGTSKRSTT